MITAVDPGNIESAWVRWDEIHNRIQDFDKQPNEDVLVELRDSAGICVIEQIKSYGMAVGESIFETCVWTGRFMEAFGADRVHRISRTDVKVHLCRSAKAKDANVRQALIDRFGGKEKAIGTKKAPGPLYGVSGDVWAALAVAITWTDQREFDRRIGRTV